jgi:hypothetical protein
MYQDIPTQSTVETAQEVLKKIMEDQDLTELIKETVKDMSAEELRGFRKDLQGSIADMNDELKREQNEKVLEELEAKREAQKIAKEARKQLREEQKAVWDTLSKEERQELVKAKVAQIAYETGTTLKDGALAVGMVMGAGLAAVGGIIAQGVIAIGQGIINAASAIWNWIDEHFYVRIDFSCAKQRKMRKKRKYTKMVKKQRPIVQYTGGCPKW